MPIEKETGYDKEVTMRSGRIALFIAICLIFAVPAVAQQQIVLGVPTSLKLIEGYEGHKAAQLAVEEINARGGVKVGAEKRLLKVEALDIRDGEPGVPVSEALLGIEKLILDKKIYAAVVGNFRSEALLAAMDIYSKYKVINVGTIAMTPKFQEKVLSDKEKYKYSFRNCLDSKYLAGYMQNMMRHINKEFGYNKVFIATQDVLWATATGSMMEKWFKDNGWTVTGFEKYPVGATDFSAGLMKAKSAGVQVILPIFDMPTSGILVKQWKSMKIPALMAGFISPLMGTKAWKTFGGDIEGLMNVVFEIGYFPIKAHAPSVKFSEAYLKRWKEDIQSGHGAAPAYDTVYVLAAAIEKAGTLDADKVAAAIQATDMVGVVGRIRFDESHQLIFGEDPKQAAAGAVMQWQKGKMAVVWPASIASEKIQKPGWMK
jgi:branched-chain amino acid transport system substrate-binding protein